MACLARSFFAVLLLATVSSGQSPDPQKPLAPPLDQKVVSPGYLVKKVQPKYPKEARAARIEGTVVLHAIIDKAGHVQELNLVSGPPMLAPAAIKAVKKWRYRPYRLDGRAIELDTTIEVKFELN